jgi:hypothetical protein
MVKVLGMVNATPDYTEQPIVINGYTELMKKVFGFEHGASTFLRPSRCPVPSPTGAAATHAAESLP